MSNELSPVHADRPTRVCVKVARQHEQRQNEWNATLNIIKVYQHLLDKK